MPANRNNRRSSRRDSRQNQANRSNDAMAGLAALGLIGILAITAFFLLRHPSEGSRTDLLVAADVTGSVGVGDRQKLFGILDETIDGVLPKGSEVRLWAFDVNAHAISDKTPRKAQDLWPDEDQCIAHRQKMGGTLPANVLKEMAVASEQATGRGENIGMMVLTDGEDTDTDKKALEAVVTRISKMSSVKAVWFAGASTENGFRSTLERRLGPILGNRLVVSSNGDAQDGLNRFRALIENR